MSMLNIPPTIERRYPTLRFLVGFYKVVGVIVLAGSVIVGIYQLVAIRLGMLGFFAMLSTILSGVAIGGLCWLVAEGIEVFMAIEENTRMAAMNMRTGTAAPPAEDLKRLMQQMLEEQINTNHRLDALVNMLVAMRSNVSSGVQGIDAIAESSKVMATILYRQNNK
ncbi:hypothetical protein OSCT_0891 [Oscillochloris trichoides DG-6]|uniref:Uncharacterized protein n=1 Tax=Oscillochloris trichoides DG-6 TaxID=765420 RepID=E1IC40_9CHLR|nr:hypothetical protein [Oscillochloris trichoides]EFO81230.1 hypothetical protein OSCT_0891 [Oscillochloris trichoides DG-6]